MKALSRSAVLVFLLLPVLAFSASLKENMKQIGSIVKTLQSAVNDKSKNASSAVQAHQLIALFTAARDQIPDSIASLPPQQQPAAVADYQAILQQEINDAKRLETAFRTNDNGAASRVLEEMQNGKSEGHRKYK